MRHTFLGPDSLGKGLAALLLAVSLGVPAQALADEPSAPPAEDPVAVLADDPTAEEVLETAEQSLAGDIDLEPTLALAAVQEQYSEMTPAERSEARVLLARPTRQGDPATYDPEGSHNDGLLEYTTNETKPYCRLHVCVHYVRSTPDAPPLTDNGGASGVPDWVETVANEMETVWAREVGDLGYRRPVGDGTKGEPAAASGTLLDPFPDPPAEDRLDVYLGNVGAYGFYGYTATDPYTVQPYLVLDDDFYEFTGSPLASLRVTAAHEFFHGIQFSYDIGEDPWLMEGTATWMEERVFDGANDNRLYLPSSSLRNPGVSLDVAGNSVYGNWVFFEYLSQRYGAGIVRNIWLRAAKSGIHSALAVQRELVARTSSFAQHFSAFSVASNVPRAFYSEGAAYPVAKLVASWTLNPWAISPGLRSVRVNHLASRNYRFITGKGLAGAWKLRVKVNGPSGVSRAMLLVRNQNGTVTRKVVPLNRYGNGAVSVPFRYSTTRSVILNLANTSLRYACNQGGLYSCNGWSYDDNRAFSFKAFAYR